MPPITRACSSGIQYPTVTPVEGYIRQAVKIEAGAKSAFDPNCETTIRPYLANDVASLNLEVAGVTTIVAVRTFCDKVTTIHGQRRWFERRGALWLQGQRVSRHYYDLYRLLNSEVGNSHCQIPLSPVIVCDTLACSSTARIRPRNGHPRYVRPQPFPAMTESLRRDYDRMAGMIIGAVPSGGFGGSNGKLTSSAELRVSSF